MFVAMCGKAQKLEAELKRSKSFAATLEEDLHQMRRERALRSLRPRTVVDQTMETGVATVRISEAAMVNSSTRQTSAEVEHVQDDVAQDNGDGRWYDEGTGYMWFRASPEAVTSSTGQTGASPEPTHGRGRSSSRNRMRRHSRTSFSSSSHVSPASDDSSETGGRGRRPRRRPMSSSTSELSSSRSASRSRRDSRHRGRSRERTVAGCLGVAPPRTAHLRVPVVPAGLDSPRLEARRVRQSERVYSGQQPHGFLPLAQWRGPRSTAKTAQSPVRVLSCWTASLRAPQQSGCRYFRGFRAERGGG